MSTAWVVFRKELRETLRDRRTLIVMVAIPHPALSGAAHRHRAVRASRHTPHRVRGVPRGRGRACFGGRRRVLGLGRGPRAGRRARSRGGGPLRSRGSGRDLRPAARGASHAERYCALQRGGRALAEGPVRPDRGPSELGRHAPCPETRRARTSNRLRPAVGPRRFVGGSGRRN